MGQDGHVLTFPVAHGTKLNVVAFRTTPDEWDGEGTTKPSTREDALRDFAGFGKGVISILKLTEEEPSMVCPHSCLSRQILWDILLKPEPSSGPSSTWATIPCLPSTRAASA